MEFVVVDAVLVDAVGFGAATEFPLAALSATMGGGGAIARVLASTGPIFCTAAALSAFRSRTGTPISRATFLVASAHGTRSFFSFPSLNIRRVSGVTSTGLAPADTTSCTYCRMFAGNSLVRLVERPGLPG